MKVRFTVERVMEDNDKTFAFVSAEVKDSSLGNTQLFTQAPGRALSKWIAGTETGFAAWSGSRFTFNVGDLEGYQSSDTLAEYLREEGISDLLVETLELAPNGLWKFDDILPASNILEENGDSRLILNFLRELTVAPFQNKENSCLTYCLLLSL